MCRGGNVRKNKIVKSVLLASALTVGGGLTALVSPVFAAKPPYASFIPESSLVGPNSIDAPNVIAWDAPFADIDEENQVLVGRDFMRWGHGGGLEFAGYNLSDVSCVSSNTAVFTVTPRESNGIPSCIAENTHTGIATMTVTVNGVGTKNITTYIIKAAALEVQDVIDTIDSDLGYKDVGYDASGNPAADLKADMDRILPHLAGKAMTLTVLVGEECVEYAGTVCQQYKTYYQVYDGRKIAPDAEYVDTTDVNVGGKETISNETKAVVEDLLAKNPDFDAGLIETAKFIELSGEHRDLRGTVTFKVAVEGTGEYSHIYFNEETGKIEVLANLVAEKVGSDWYVNVDISHFSSHAVVKGKLALSQQDGGKDAGAASPETGYYVNGDESHVRAALPVVAGAAAVLVAGAVVVVRKRAKV
jgi:hypothetical protein